jgi:hypothetical protein
MVSGLQVRDSSDFHREQRAFEAVKSLFMLAKPASPPAKVREPVLTSLLQLDLSIR